MIDREAGHPTANFRLGECYLWVSEFDQAANCLERVLATDPENTGALINLSVAKQSLGDDRAAVQLLQRALQQEPASLAAKNNLAWLLATSQDQAVQDSKQAVHIALEAAEAADYRDANLLDTLSIAYAAAGETALASHWLEKCIELSPVTRHAELRARLDKLNRKALP